MQNNLLLKEDAKWPPVEADGGSKRRKTASSSLRAHAPHAWRALFRRMTERPLDLSRASHSGAPPGETFTSAPSALARPGSSMEPHLAAFVELILERYVELALLRVASSPPNSITGGGAHLLHPVPCPLIHLKRAKERYRVAFLTPIIHNRSFLLYPRLPLLTHISYAILEPASQRCSKSTEATISAKSTRKSYQCYVQR